MKQKSRLAIGLVALLLAACGGAGSSGDSGTSGSSTSSTPTASSPAPTGNSDLTGTGSATPTTGQLSAKPTVLESTPVTTNVGSAQFSSGGSSSTAPNFTSASNYGEFIVQHGIGMSAKGDRQVPDCLSVNSGTVSFLFSSWARYVANVYIIDKSAAQNFVNGGSCTNCIYDSKFSSSSGYHIVNLGVGNYCIGLENLNNGANRVGYELTPWYTEGFAGWVYNGTSLSVVKALSPGGWSAQPFTIRPNTRVILDGGNNGGNVYIIPAAAINEFTSTNGGATGVFHYLLDSKGGLICSTGSQGDEGAPEDCPGLEQYLAPGDYYMAFLNPSTNKDPITFVAFAAEFVPK